jgi:hypothetical protein
MCTKDKYLADFYSLILSIFICKNHSIIDKDCSASELFFNLIKMQLLLFIITTNIRYLISKFFVLFKFLSLIVNNIY